MIFRILNFFKNLFFVFLINIVYFIPYALFLGVVCFILVQTWLFYSNNFLNTPSFIEWELTQPGYLCFALFLLLLLSNFSNFQTSQIKFTIYYLNNFSTPEKAVYFWFSFRFYLALVLSCFLVYTSFKSQLNLCNVDGAFLLLLKNPDWSSYFFPKFMEKILSANILNLLFIFLICLLLHYFARESRYLSFLQALLLVVSSGCLLFASWFELFQFSMLYYYSITLTISCLACAICLVDKFWWKNRVEMALQQLLCNNRFLKGDSIIGVTEKQYFKSYLAYLAGTNFLYWSFLFNNYTNLFFFKVDEVTESAFCNSYMVGFLFVALWLFIGCRFLKFAACHSLNESQPQAKIPVVPLLIYGLYITPLLKIMTSSWYEVKKVNIFQKAFLVVLNPALGLKLDPTFSAALRSTQSLKDSSHGVTMVCSPSESSGLSPDPASATSWLLHRMESWARDRFFTDSVVQARQNVELAAEPARQVLQVVGDNSEIGKHLNSGISNLVQARLSLIPAEKQLHSTQQSQESFHRAALAIQKECGSCCDFSPRSGLPRDSDLPSCFNRFANLKKAMAATEGKSGPAASFSVLEDAIDKAI